MKRILVVDDSATIRALAKHALSRVPGYAVDFAVHGAQAVTRIESSPPDLVFLDINMPGMDGLEVLTHLGATGVLPRVPVVIVSTEGNDADIARARALGARDYITKPFKPAALLAVAERLLGGAAPRAAT